MPWLDQYRHQERAWKQRSRNFDAAGKHGQAEQANDCAEVYRKLAEREQDRLDKDRRGC